MPNRIHVFGASGSGTTSLASALAAKLVVFLLVPTEVRLARLRAREIERYGHEAIAAGGKLHQAHVEFLDWAERYDTGGVETRSRTLHEAWLARLPGAVLRLEDNQSVADQLAQIEASV
jgi:adenylate kinase family enzyme